MPSFSTRTAALRSLMDISADAVKHAKHLITERADGKFYFDEDQAEQFLNTQDDITNANLENNMTTITLENLKTVTTAELVTFYNDHAESSVKKFRDRATAEKKVQVILEALAAEEPVAKPEPMIGGMTLAETVAFAKSVTEKKGYKTPKSIMGEMMKALDTKMTPPEVREELHIPQTQILANIKDEHFIAGTQVPEAKATSGDRTISDTQAETMKTTLKLDRTIVCGDEEWKNAFQMWKAHTDWMTSAQQDGLTAKLYKAAKAGDRIEVTINGRTFSLKNV